MMEINREMGVAWTGDQYIINWGLCPHWHVGVKDDFCGRLPWIYNVQVTLYALLHLPSLLLLVLHLLNRVPVLMFIHAPVVQVLNYNAFCTVQAIADKPAPRVIHFISDGKPWVVLGSEMHDPQPIIEQLRQNNNIFVAHALWRCFYYRALAKLHVDSPQARYAKDSCINTLFDVTKGADPPPYLSYQAVYVRLFKEFKNAGGTGSFATVASTSDDARRKSITKEAGKKKFKQEKKSKRKQSAKKSKLKKKKAKNTKKMEL